MPTHHNQIAKNLKTEKKILKAARGKGCITDRTMMWKTVDFSSENHGGQ